MDQVLGLLMLAGYILGVVGLAAAITYAVIRIFPTERNPKKPEQPGEETSEPGNGAPAGGSLFRRAKRRGT